MNELIQKVKKAYPKCYVRISLDVISSSSGEEMVDYGIVIHPRNEFGNVSDSLKIRQEFNSYESLSNFVNSISNPETRDTIADIPQGIYYLKSITEKETV